MEGNIDDGFVNYRVIFSYKVIYIIHVLFDQESILGIY